MLRPQLYVGRSSWIAWNVSEICLGVVLPKACGITAQSYITLFAYYWNISGDTLGRTCTASSSRGRQNRPMFSVMFFKSKDLWLRQVVFLLAFAHSIHAQPVPINSTVGYSENLYAKFSYPLMRKKECGYSEWSGQTDGRRVSLSTSTYYGW